MANNNSIIDGIFREISSIEIGVIRRSPFPTRIEEVMKSLISLFELGSNEDRDYIHAKVNSKISFVFLWFAKHMSIVGVRLKSEECLRLGLISIVIENFTFDMRDSFTPVALLYHSAQILGCDVKKLFKAAAKYGTPKTRQVIEDFPSRPPSTLLLSAFGYKESTSPAEFDYLSMS